MTLEQEASAMYFEACHQNYRDEQQSVCCCGDDMERHSYQMSCGHSPVSVWDYALSCYLRETA